MIPLFAEIEPDATFDLTRALTLTVGCVATGAAVLPALLGFAEPVHRGAVAMAWIKHIVGVLICGALIARGNWIYTLFSAQWTQAGLPDLPPMVSRPGSGQAPSIGSSSTGIPGARSAGAPAATATRQPQSSFLDEYRD